MLGSPSTPKTYTGLQDCPVLLNYTTKCCWNSPIGMDPAPMSYRCHLLPVEEKKHIRIYVMRDRQVNPPTEGSKHAEVIFAMFTNNWDSDTIGFVLKSKKRRSLSRITQRQYYLPKCRPSEHRSLNSGLPYFRKLFVYLLTSR